MGVHPLKTIELLMGRTFSVVNYDILFEKVDCIVNAANGGLSHGGGVAAVISRAAGMELDDECERIVKENGPVPVGGAVATTAGKLPFKAVIHAVGPRMGDGDEEDKIVQALQSAFKIASYNGWKSISFPAISSGIYSVPLDVCARAYVRAVVDFFPENPDSSINTIRLCLRRGPLVDMVIGEMDLPGGHVSASAVPDEDEEIPVIELDLDGEDL